LLPLLDVALVVPLVAALLLLSLFGAVSPAVVGCLTVGASTKERKGADDGDANWDELSIQAATLWKNKEVKKKKKKKKHQCRV